MPVELAEDPRLVESPFAQRILAYYQPQGRSNDCGPFSTAMLINAFCGTKVDPSSLARDLDKVRWVGPFPLVRRIPRWATFPWGVVDALRLQGLQASWYPFGNPRRLVELLQAGKLLVVFIGAWWPLWGHVMVLLAYDPLRGWGFADSAWWQPELHWIEDGVFRSQWRTYANTYVVVEP